MSDKLNWRKVSLEGVAVILGILIAFGIDAAWDARQESRRVAAYLVSLDDELAENATQIRVHLDSLAATRARTEQYIVALAARSDDAALIDSIPAMVRDMPLADERPLSRSAFDDLISGGLQLIDDASIRRAILRYGQLLEFNERRMDATEQWWETRFGPFDERYGDLVGMGSLYNEGWLGRRDLAVGVDESAFVGNRQYTNLLAARFYRLGMVESVRDELLAEIEGLRQAVASR